MVYAQRVNKAKREQRHITLSRNIRSLRNTTHSNKRYVTIIKLYSLGHRKFSSDYGLKMKEAETRYRTNMSLF